jgi:hypothetical protein
VAKEEVVLNRFVDRLEAFLGRYQVVIAAVTILVVAIGIFAYYRTRLTTDRTEAAQSDLTFVFQRAAPPRLAKEGKQRELTAEDFTALPDGILPQAEGTSAEPFARIAYASFLMEKGRFEPAAEVYADIRKKFPKHLVEPQAEVFGAMALEELGRYEEARGVLSRFVKESKHEYWKQVAGEHLGIVENLIKTPASRPATKSASTAPAVLKAIELGK